MLWWLSLLIWWRMRPIVEELTKCIIYFLFLQLYANNYDNAIQAVDGAALVHSLPGYGPLPFKLETGYISVGEDDEVQLFYYFVESEGNPVDDPVVLWLTGGPGCSGISGLVYEIGPLRFNKIKYNGTLPTLTLNPYSWTRVSSIIFIDAPVGTGFSYSKSLRGSTTGDKLHAHHSHQFLKKWLWNHTRFRKNPVYIGGDSYSGMIVPLLAQEILQEDKKDDYGPLINFNGYVLGNPVTDSFFDDNSKVAFAYHMALIPQQLYKSAKRSCQGDYITRQQMTSQCVRDIQDISKRIEQVNDAHILEPKCVFLGSTRIHNNRIYLLSKNEEEISTGAQIPGFHCRSYFDLLCNIWGDDPRVQKALHIREETTRFWTRCNGTLDYVKDVPTVVKSHLHLNDKGCRALIYSGDHDMIIPYLGTQSWIKSLNLVSTDEWRPWYVNSQVAGYVTEYGNNFTFATVKGGGHTAPEYLPRECFAMFKRWIHHQSL